MVDSVYDLFISDCCFFALLSVYLVLLEKRDAGILRAYMEIYKADNARMHHDNVMRVDTAYCNSDELAGRISASELFPRQNT